MILLYQQSNQLSYKESAAAEAIEATGRRLGYRNAQAFRAEDVEKKAVLVITDVEAVRKAYEAQGIDVQAVGGDVDEALEDAPEPVDEDATYRIEERGGGWYDVVGPDGQVNEKGLREEDAQALLAELTT